MALPASGDLSIKDGSGTTRSIAREVDGNVTGDKSLDTLGITAGLDSFDTSMTEFYGYSSATTPSAPTGASSSIVGGGQVQTTWTDNSEGTGEEDNFRVEARFKVSGGSYGAYTFIANEPTDDTTNTFNPTTPFPTASNGDYVQVRVRAENTAGQSAYNEATEIVLSGLPE